MKVLRLAGEVFSGAREGARFMRLLWVKKQIRGKLGFVPYPGTLNLWLTEGSIKLRRVVAEKSIDIVPEEGFYPGKCCKAFLKRVKCGIVIPEVPGYPEDKLEIIGPLNLRGRFGFSDGELIEVRAVF